MKKAISVISLVLALATFGFSQGAPQKTRTYNFTTATTTAAKDWDGAGYGYYKIKWEVKNGTLSACTVKLEGSTDGATWSVNNITGTQTCTTDGETAIVAAGAYSSYIRVNVLTYTASSAGVSLNVTVSTWNEVIGATSSNSIITTGGGGGAATIADGADVAEGATTDAATTAGGTGTVSGKLREITSQLNNLTVKITATNGDTIQALFNPCSTNSSASVPIAFSVTTAAASSTIVAAVNLQKVYICDYEINTADAAGSFVTLVAGTGTTCGTIVQTFLGSGNNNATDGWFLAASGGGMVKTAGGTPVIWGSTNGDDFCMFTGGKKTQISGHYVHQGFFDPRYWYLALLWIPMMLWWKRRMCYV